MRWAGSLMQLVIGLAGLAAAGLCRADAITDYCKKPDIPNPKVCEDQMRGHAGRDWPNTASPRANSKVKVGKAEQPPKLAARGAQKWLKRVPAWPHTPDEAAVCAKSTLSKELEAEIQNENQMSVQRNMLPQAAAKDAKKQAKDPDIQEFAKFESDADLQQCMSMKSTDYQLEEPSNTPHSAEALTVPVRAAREQQIEGCTRPTPEAPPAQPCDVPEQCSPADPGADAAPLAGPDPDCELKADADYDAALKAATQKWLVDEGQKYAADRNRVQMCLNKLSAYHKAAVRAHNAGANTSPAAVGAAVDLSLVRDLNERVVAHCKAASQVASRPPGG